MCQWVGEENWTELISRELGQSLMTVLWLLHMGPTLGPENASFC